MENQSKQFIDPLNDAHNLAIKLMANWISAMADQVKNPIAGISAAAGVIDKQMKSYRATQKMDALVVEEAVRLMQERLSRFDNYLSELSGFTRSVHLDLKWFDVKSVWPEIQIFLGSRIVMSYSLTVGFEQVNQQEPLKLYCDLERFKGICAALISNSIEACGSTISPNIEVFFSKRERSNSSDSGLVMRMSDNGPGFPLHALSQAASPFFTTKEAGTGLGLAMVDKYLKAHGGSLHVANCEELVGSKVKVVGAVVEVFLPYPKD